MPFMYDHKLPVMAIVESWLTEKVNVDVPGHALIRNDRSLINLDILKDTRGGGVCICVLSGLNSTQIALQSTIDF